MDKIVSKKEINTILSANAAFEYCRNETLNNEILTRVHHAVKDSAFDSETIANRVRSVVQEIDGANEFSSQHIWEGKYAIPTPDPGAKVSDSQLFDIFGNRIGTMESKHYYSEGNFSAVYNEFQPGGKYEGQVPNLNSELTEYFNNRGYDGKIITTDVSDEKVQSTIEILKDGSIAQDQLSLTLTNAATGGLVGGAVGGVMSMAFNGYKLHNGTIDEKEFWQNVQTDTLCASISGVAVGTIGSFVTLTFPVGTLIAIGTAAVARKIGTAIIEDINIKPDHFIRPLSGIEQAQKEMIAMQFKRRNQFIVDIFTFIKSMQTIDSQRKIMKQMNSRILEETKQKELNL